MSAGQPRYSHIIQVESGDVIKQSCGCNQVATPTHAWSTIVNILSLYTSPIWPVWVPLWQFPTEADTTGVNKQIETIFQQAKPPVCIIACSDLLETITRAKYVTAPDLATVTDWFTFLEQ